MAAREPRHSSGTSVVLHPDPGATPRRTSRVPRGQLPVLGTDQMSRTVLEGLGTKSGVWASWTARHGLFAATPAKLAPGSGRDGVPSHVTSGSESPSQQHDGAMARSGSQQLWSSDEAAAFEAHGYRASAPTRTVRPTRRLASARPIPIPCHSSTHLSTESMPELDPSLPFTSRVKDRRCWRLTAEGEDGQHVLPLLAQHQRHGLQRHGQHLFDRPVLLLSRQGR
jgi:hypothetical protein